MGALVELTNVCTGMVLVPEVITPVIPAGCTAVHEKVAPEVVLLRFTKAEVAPEQMA
jgi:hypothetical protein